MAWAFLTCNCAGCGNLMTCSPTKVPSLVIDGVREPICKTCFQRWNQIHRTSKGLEPIPLLPGAYEPADMDEL